MVLPFPVLPGKDPQAIAKRLEKEPDAYREDRANAGVVIERAYLQHTQMGDFVVAYIESERGLTETMGAISSPKTEIGRWFLEQVKEIHGVDMTQRPEKLPELVAEWIDPGAKDRRQGFAFCAPLIPEKVEYGRTRAKELYADPEMTRVNRELGENLEVVMLTHTEKGPICAVYIEATDAERANRDFAASEDPFNVKFKAFLREVFPPFVDFSQPVEGVTEIFDSEKLGGADLTGRPRQASQATTSG
jgi:hypothetical protein